MVGCVGGESGEPSTPIPIQKLPRARMGALGDSARLNAYGTMLGLGVEETNMMVPGVSSGDVSDIQVSLVAVRRRAWTRPD